MNPARQAVLLSPDMYMLPATAELGKEARFEARLGKRKQLGAVR
jgi:hypothetical protein